MGIRYLLNQHHQSSQNNQERKIECREKISDGIDPCHIARKDKEKYKGQKQCPSFLAI